MVLDIQYNKVEVFADVNDNAIPPTTTSAGNGSHLIKKYNDFVDEIEYISNNLQNNIDSLSDSATGKWIIVFNDYIAQPNQKIVFDLNNATVSRGTYTLELPTNPPIGSYITFVNTNGGIELDILNYNKINSNSYYTRVYISDSYVQRTLLYCGTGIGWLTTTPDDYIKTVQSN